MLNWTTTFLIVAIVADYPFFTATASAAAGRNNSVFPVSVVVPAHSLIGPMRF
jgi:uncharacterized membrane protein YtjA (UPF0391 family)